MEKGELYERVLRMVGSSVAAVLLSFVLVAGIGHAAPGETQPRPHARTCQSALVITNGSSATLILQLSYQGQSGGLAWLIPVPARPEANETNPQIFRELERISEPVLVRPPGDRRYGVSEQTGDPFSAESSCTPQASITVFPADDIARARRWLCPNGSSPSPRTETALNHYADLGWWYVGVGVSLRSWRAAIAEDLRAVDGGETGFGPEAVAHAILADADSGRAEGGQRAAALGRLVDSLRSAVEESADGESPVSWEEKLAGAYANVMDSGRLRHAGRLDSRRVLGCLDGIAADVGLDKLLAAASTTGLSCAIDIDSLADDLSNSLGRDLRDGVPYPDSHWRRWHDCLALLGLLNEDAFAGTRVLYRDLGVILRECASFPPANPGQLMAGPSNLHPGQRGANADDPLFKAVCIQLLRLTTFRGSLYRSVRDAYDEATQAADGHLAQGVLPTLCLEFPSAQPVCAPALSDECPRPDDINVYVVSGHKVRAPGYRIAYAHRLLPEELAAFPHMAGLVASEGAFLTALRAEGGSADPLAASFEDTLFEAAHCGYTTPDGQILSKTQAVVYALVGVVARINAGPALALPAALAGSAVVWLVVLRRRRSADRSP